MTNSIKNTLIIKIYLHTINDMEKRYKKPVCQAIKNYYNELVYSNGKTSKKIAEVLGMSAVSLSNLSGRLDQMTAENLEKLAVELNVKPSDFITNILSLRKNC